MARVFPLPAPARTSTGPSGAVTAARCPELSSERMSSGPFEAEPVDLFNSHRLRQIARLVDVTTSGDGDVVGEKLKRHHCHQGRDGLGVTWKPDQPIGVLVQD